MLTEQVEVDRQNNFCIWFNEYSRSPNAVFAQALERLFKFSHG